MDNNQQDKPNDHLANERTFLAWIRTFWLNWGFPRRYRRVNGGRRLFKIQKDRETTACWTVLQFQPFHKHFDSGNGINQCFINWVFDPKYLIH